MSTAVIDTFRARMSRVPTSVVIAATLHDERPVGMLVGTFASVSLEPSLVGFLGDLSSTTVPLLLAADRICFSVLAQTAYPAVTQAFRRPSRERFEGLGWTASPSGLPRVGPAVLYVEGSVYGTGAAGDHMIIRVQPDLIECGEAESPLVFWGGRMMGIGATELPSPIWQLGQVRP